MLILGVAMSEELTILLQDGPPRVRPCSCMKKVCYGLGHVYNDLCAAVWFSYTLFYLQIVLQLEPTAAGVLVMLGKNSHQGVGVQFLFENSNRKPLKF